MRGPWLSFIAALGFAGGTWAQQPAEVIVLDGARPDATGRFRIPAGARVEPSGFLTIEQAPPSTPPTLASPRRPENEQTYYAELTGVSKAEAARRMRQQEAQRPAAERLVRQLRTREPRHLGRIGETFSWAGPIAIGENAPMVAPLALMGESAVTAKRFAQTRERPSKPRRSLAARCRAITQSQTGRAFCAVGKARFRASRIERVHE